LREIGLNRDARDVFMRILGLDPAFPAALAQYGLTHRDSGNTTGACAVFERAILLAPHIADTYGFLGATLSDIASDDIQRARAHRSFFLSLALEPAEPEALNNLGVLLHKMKRYAEAKSVLGRAMALMRDYADPRSNLGVVLQSERQLQRAVDSYAQALVLAPGFYQAINNLGSAEWHLGNTERALACFGRTLTISPDYASAAHNQCKVLHGSLRLDEAIQGYEDLGRRFPDLPDVFWHHSLALLARGDYERGWRLYEYRWVSEKRETLGMRGPLETMWTGGATPAGCRLLIYAEQGLGDTLQFCRYAPVLTARGTEVITRVPNALARLLRGQQGFGTVIGFDDPVPNFGLHCPMMSLPLALGTTLATVPFCSSPYLHALSSDVTNWDNRFREMFGRSEPGRRALRVGLVWQGGFRPEEPESWAASQRRNIPLEAFAAALDIPGIDFVSLQKGDPAESELRGRESEFWKKGRIFNIAEDLRDFADTAGVIANLDLVISVDTSTAHLSAAMGKPTWILNRYDTCWRWLLDREDSPWYHSVKLYRQGSDRSWQPVLDRMSHDLCGLAERFA
jgi:tetratricopeptide (TPR) repeat protein